MWILAVAAEGSAQTPQSDEAVAPGPAASAVASSPGGDATLAVPTRITCASMTRERVYCAGYTSDGVLLLKSTGVGECLLGRTWGYDANGVWVSDGCSAEFASSQSASAQGTTQPSPAQPPATQTPDPQTANNGSREPTPRIETWGEFDPGDGFLVARSKVGELAISGYGVLRYIDQTPATQAYTDHLGNERQTDARNDVFPHRIIIYLKGWLGSRSSSTRCSSGP